MNLKKSHIISLMLILALTLFLSISTLSLKAVTNQQSTEKGNWKEVCCGEGCVFDYCDGSGNKICCK